MEEDKTQVELNAAFAKAKADATSNITKGLMKILTTVGTIALEGLIIMYLWNYVFPDLSLNYGKALALLIAARTLFRTSSQNK